LHAPGAAAIGINKERGCIPGSGYVDQTGNKKHPGAAGDQAVKTVQDPSVPGNQAGKIFYVVSPFIKGCGQITQKGPYDHSGSEQQDSSYAEAYKIPDKKRSDQRHHDPSHKSFQGFIGTGFGSDLVSSEKLSGNLTETVKYRKNDERKKYPVPFQIAETDKSRRQQAVGTKG
jgi:hypothetical protein